MASFTGGHLGAPNLTVLPSDPRERLLSLFPLFPAAFATDSAVTRVSELLDALRSPSREEHAAAEAQLMELELVHSALEKALDEEGELAEFYRGCSRC
jgi:hypothetical protein